MRIFEVITVSEYGGAQTVVANIAEEMCRQHEIYILSGGNGEAWQHLKGKVHLIKLDGHRKQISLKDIFLACKLLYFRIKYRPDIIHLHSSKMGVLGRLIFNPRKVVLTLHGFDSVRKAYRKFLIVEKKLKNRAAKIIAVSQYDVDCMKEEGIEKNISLIYNGVTDHYVSAENKVNSSALNNELKKIREQYPSVIMCISRISPQKKFDLFLEIARQLPKYGFVWIGNKEKVENHPDNVYCLGEASQAYRYLNYADVFILPSNYEGFPISILEALSYKKPVVASAVGGITEMLDGTNGFAVENDPQDFIEKIEYILSKDNYNTMSVNARNSYLEKYTLDKMISGYSYIFSSIYKENNK